MDIKPVGGIASLALPLDAYQINTSTQDLTVKAFSAVYKKCMARFGFVSPPRNPRGKSPLRNDRRYGITAIETSKLYGYHVADDAVRERADRQAPSDAEVAVSQGTRGATYQGKNVPAGGCMGEAQREVAKEIPEVDDDRLGDKLASEAYDRSKQDSRVRQVFATWSACMKESGYSYPDPMSAMDDPAFSTPRPTATEIQTAVADISCKERTHLTDVWGSVETAYQRRALEQNAEALNEVKDHLRAKEAAAAKILGTSS